MHVEEAMDADHPSFVEVLERETAILAKRVAACKSRVLMATCFVGGKPSWKKITKKSWRETWPEWDDESMPCLRFDLCLKMFDLSHALSKLDNMSSKRINDISVPFFSQSTSINSLSSSYVVHVGFLKGLYRVFTNF